MEKFSSGEPSAGGWNQPPSIQRSKTRCSTAPGSQRVVALQRFSALGVHGRDVNCAQEASRDRDRQTASPWLKEETATSSD